MAFTLQLDDGSVVGANAYIDANYFKAYHADRGNDVSAYGTPDIQRAIVKACDYADYRWHRRLIGTRLTLAQRTAWPRRNAVTSDGLDVSYSVPVALKEAVAEYALSVLDTGDLAPIPVLDASGRPLKAQLTKVGPITLQTEFVDLGTQVASIRPYPTADRLMRPLLIGSTGLERA